MLKPAVRLAALVVGASLFVAADAQSQGSPYKIVVNQTNPTSSLSKTQISNIFLRKQSTWDTGEPVLPVDQVESSPLREAFSKDVLGMSPAAADQTLSSQHVDRPMSVGTDREVLAYVRLKPGAIGYISAATQADGVKVVGFGRSAGGGTTWQDAITAGGAIPMPTKTHHVPPVYPQLARESRTQGDVQLEILINPAGIVEDARVIKPILLLNDAALTAVKQWRFAPTAVNGKAVPVRMLVRVTFELH
jgi:TonB family protein